VDGHELRPLDRLHDQLRDAIAPLDGVRLVRIGVDQDDPHLVAVAGVDQARRVEAGDAVTQREPAAWQHEPGEAVGDGDRDAGRYDTTAAAGLDRRRLPRVEIGTGVASVRVRRQWQLRVETNDRHLDHAVNLWCRRARVDGPRDDRPRSE